jgi:hypothetical protein
MRRLLFLLLLAAPGSAADITITIPDALLPRVVDGFCGAFNYDVNRSTATNETKAQFARRMMMGVVRQTVVSYEFNQAQTTARQGLESQVQQIQNEVDF